jgi:hypothetical protein
LKASTREEEQTDLLATVVSMLKKGPSPYTRIERIMNGVFKRYT